MSEALHGTVPQDTVIVSLTARLSSANEQINQSYHEIIQILSRLDGTDMGETTSNARPELPGELGTLEYNITDIEEIAGKFQSLMPMIRRF
jgi:hypothetical protein